MLAPLAATLFVATIALALAALVLLFEQSRGKIVAALRGRSLLATTTPARPIELRVSQRYPSPARRPLRAAVERAAA